MEVSAKYNYELGQMALDQPLDQMHQIKYYFGTSSNKTSSNGARPNKALDQMN